MARIRALCLRLCPATPSEDCPRTESPKIRIASRSLRVLRLAENAWGRIGMAITVGHLLMSKETLGHDQVKIVEVDDLQAAPSFRIRLGELANSNSISANRSISRKA